MAIYEGINKKLCQMKKDLFFKSSELSDRLVKSTAYGIDDSLNRTYDFCDNDNSYFNSLMANEE